MPTSRNNSLSPIRHSAIVLCGGRSQRMGTDKASMELGGEALLHRVCRLLAEEYSSIVVVSAPDQSLPQLPRGVVVLHDEEPGKGPLVGFQTGLRHLVHADPAADQTRHLMLLASCDNPFVSSGVARAMAERLGKEPGMGCHVVRHAGQLQPFHGIYRGSVLDQVEELTRSGARSLRSVLESSGVIVSDSESLRSHDADLAFLTNVNSPQDLARAGRMLSKK